MEFIITQTMSVLGKVYHWYTELIIQFIFNIVVGVGQTWL